MSVFKESKSPYYRYDFRLHNRRFFGSTKATNKKDALEIERGLRTKARSDLEAEKRTGNAPITLDYAAGRYWQEVGRYHTDSAATFRNMARLVGYFGKTKRLDQITDADVSALVAWRRGQTVRGRVENQDGKPVATIAPATVNRSTTEVLKKLFTRAKRTWRFQFRLEPNWRDHWLKEPQGRVRELHEGEEQALDQAVRGDYAPWLQFALMTGLRRAETLLRWSNVNWQAQTITIVGKGGRTVSTPITGEVAALLEPLKDHHPEFVFTYVANRTRGEQGEPGAQVKGKRYPITYEGSKTEWQRMRARAGVHDFRFHDLRHTTATRLLRETKSLKLVQHALNHRDIATTARYAHVLDSEVAEALQHLAASRKKSPNKSPTEN
jgi:integrase